MTFDSSTTVSLVPIKTFDTGAQATKRPLVIWLVVQCKMPNWTAQGSGYFAGQAYRFVPALKKLEKQDMVGVAHWCDNGDPLARNGRNASVPYTRPWSSMALATLRKPAMLAPFTRLPCVPYFSAVS